MRFSPDSRDDCMVHAEFRDKHGLAVQLLADAEGEVCEQYGVLQDKELEGSARRRCIVRSTFVIDKRGTVRHVRYRFNARGHASAVLNLVKELK